MPPAAMTPRSAARALLLSFLLRGAAAWPGAAAGRRAMPAPDFSEALSSAALTADSDRAVSAAAASLLPLPQATLGAEVPVHRADVRLGAEVAATSGRSTPGAVGAHTTAAAEAASAGGEADEEPLANGEGEVMFEYAEAWPDTYSTGEEVAEERLEVPDEQEQREDGGPLTVVSALGMHSESEGALCGSEARARGRGAVRRVVSHSWVFVTVPAPCEASGSQARWCCQLCSLTNVAG
jgi:hypothetical protein